MAVSLCSGLSEDWQGSKDHWNTAFTMVHDDLPDLTDLTYLLDLADLTDLTGLIDLDDPRKV